MHASMHDLRLGTSVITTDKVSTALDLHHGVKEALATAPDSALPSSTSIEVCFKLQRILQEELLSQCLESR
jgi:hypothetical protein